MRAIGRVLGIVVVVAAVLVPASPAAAAGGITVTPSTGLVEGQTVSIHGSGWLPNHTIGFCQAVPSASPSPSDCGGGLYGGATANGSGQFTASLVVKRSIFVPGLNRQVDCADPAEGCAIAAGAAAAQADPGTDYTAASGTVTFTPGDTAETVTISVHGDRLDEPDEFILVSFHHPTNADRGGPYGLGVARITNDDGGSHGSPPVGHAPIPGGCGRGPRPADGRAVCNRPGVCCGRADGGT